MAGPLNGIKVIEWTTWAIGPLAGAILGDSGAQVIKVEEPLMGDAARHLKWVAGFVDCELPTGRNALYECADGEWIAIALLQPDRHWRDFCTTTALQHLVDDPRFCDAEQRRIHSRELIEILDKVFAAKSRLEWERSLSENPDFVYDRV